MQGSIQEKLGRVRPPRVHITYDVETGGAIQVRELPFIVGILADLDLSGRGKRNPDRPLPPLKERKFVEIDGDNFNTVLKSVGPQLKMKIGYEDGQGNDTESSLTLDFESIDDFHPLEIAKKVDPLKDSYEVRCRLRDMRAKLDGNDPLDGELKALLGDTDKQTALKALFPADSSVEDWAKATPDDTVKALFDKGMIRDPQQAENALVLIGQFVNSVLTADIPAENPDPTALINVQIAKLDTLLSAQLNAILHDPDFQELESTWRGLNYLVSNTETSTGLKLKLLNVSKEALLDDFSKGDFDQSALFKMVYENEYGTYGGKPFSMLTGDYVFGRHPDHMRFLEKMSEVAAAAHTPFVSNAWCKLFDMADFGDLHKPRDLSKIFESLELIKWREFREKEDSRYVCLTLPRVLLRLPYGEKTDRVDGIRFEESVNGTDSKKFLWGGSAYALTQRITNAFALYGWTAAIRGVEGGGLVENLPTYTFDTVEGDKALTCPTEVAITDRREKELSELGFMSICHCKGSGKAAFFGGQTTNQPKKFNTNEANANARTSAMLPYMLAASRFAHYIKVIMRDKIGSFMTRGNVEDYLNTWIAQYVLLDDSAPQEVKARYPLRQARVVVSDVPGKPGAYKATVFLRPHFQLEELTTSIRLVAEIPS